MQYLLANLIVDFVEKILNIDPVFLLLGLVFAGIKRYYLVLLWTIPYWFLLLLWSKYTVLSFYYLNTNSVLASAKLTV
jgi:hypothetical protein